MSALVHLLWLASPALPVGAFSYSEGLEAAVDEGLVHGEASAAAWLSNQLTLVLARSELPVVAAAHAAHMAYQARVSEEAGAAHAAHAPEPAQAPSEAHATQAAQCSAGDGPEAERLQRLNAWVLHTREAAEALLQTQQMGKSLVAWLEGLQAEGTPPSATLPLLRRLQPAPTWPVVLGCAAAWRGATLGDALQAAAFGWAENMVQAAVRAVPLGQSAGQRLLAHLVPAIPGAVQQALAAGEPIAFAPRLALLQARHETQYSRLFRS